MNWKRGREWIGEGGKSFEWGRGSCMFWTLCPSVLSASLSDLYISMSDCPRRRIVSAGTNFEPLNPKLIVYCPKRRRTNQSRPPLPDQTRLASSSRQRWRRTDVETRKRWVVVVQLRLILRSYQPTPAPDPKPRCPKQAWQWDNRAAERNTVFLPLQPLRSNRQNFHAQTPRPQTSLSNAGLVDV